MYGYILCKSFYKDRKFDREHLTELLIAMGINNRSGRLSFQFYIRQRGQDFILSE